LLQPGADAHPVNADARAGAAQQLQTDQSNRALAFLHELLAGAGAAAGTEGPPAGAPGPPLGAIDSDAGRTKASATPKVSAAPCAVLWGAPLAAALAQDARCSAPSQTKAACLCKSISTDQALRPKTPEPMTKVGSADGPQKAAAAWAGIHLPAADRPPRQGVHERAVDEMRRRLHHQPHANLRSPRLMPLCPAQRQAKQPARRQPQLKKQFKPPNGRKQLQR
jgi:hypothetical protein